MLNFIRISKFGFAALAAMVMIMAASTQSQAQTGYVHLKIFKIGFIIGIGGGHGTLTYHGHTYRLRVGGVSAGTIGVAGVTLAGTASHIYHPADIVGTYGAGSASIAVIGGAKVARLQNERGVILEVHGVQMGIEASLSLGGMTIELQ